MPQARRNQPLARWDEMFAPDGHPREIYRPLLDLGLDPSNGVLADQHYLATPVGLAPADIGPVSGLYCADRAVPHRLETALRITREGA